MRPQHYRLRTGFQPVSFAYAYNSANQRTAITNADNARWVYTYDSLGQVTCGKKYWSDGTPVAGQHFEYAFDDIGNRQSTKAGGDDSGANLRPASYLNNSLNQILSREVPGYVSVLGTASNAATVTLWGDNGSYSATSRKGEYFRGEIYANNATGAVWLTITNVAVLPNGANPDIVTNTTGKTFLPKTPETFAYDLDGNLTRNGFWTNRWDGENRLIEVQTIASVPTGAKQKLVFSYDAQGRRISKTVSNWVSGNWQLESDKRFVYDGWNLVAVLNSALSLQQSFQWGLDLSGTLQGAGGVGGLLAVNDVANGVNFAAYDGNGNVMALVKGSDGTVTANYEYGPFGELVRATGLMARVSPLRFSTKYQDDETDFLYYGYRSYNPIVGRWLNRDPIGERGGLNLHCFVENAPIGYIDPLDAAAQGTPPKPLPPDPPVTPPPGKPDSGWNCAGCAFRDYLKHDLDAVKQKLSKCRKLGSCAEKCKAGECKFWLWEYDSQYSFYGELTGKKTLLPPGAMPGLDVNPKVEKGDFHIVGGNVDPKSGEDLPNVPSKMGESPCKCASNETDFGKNWKPKAEEEITRRKGHLTDPDDRLQDLVVILKRLNIVESCYCCPGMK